MNIFQKAVLYIREYRAKRELLVEVDEKGGTTGYPDDVKIKNW